VSKPNRTLAFLAYLLSIFGALYVLVFQRNDRLAAYHAKQSLTLSLVAIGAIVAWLVGCWVLCWIPLVGPLLAAALFSQVILLVGFLSVVWVLGMVRALQSKVLPLPVVGKWATWFDG
jgi:uncharacterized membrane protein